VTESIKAADRRASFDVAGNRLTPLTAGAERLEALLALIDNARHSLRLLYYIYADDDAGRTVRAAVERALARGVAVSLIVDGFGSAAPPFFEPLRQQGADVCRFLPRFGRRYLLRNHQKLILADDAVAIIGGFNIENSYFDDDAGWRDLGIRVEGSAAGRLAGYFDGLARWTHDEKPRIRRLRATLSQWSNPGGAASWLLGGPTRRLSPWAKVLRRDLLSAKRLDMIAAYFAPTPAMLRGIERVARRGGEARVVTAAKSDNSATILAARHTYHRLLRRGVRLFEYQPTRLHTKLFVIDDVVHVGSANFDVRSLFLNLEIMLRVEDRAFAAHMRRYVDGEIARSKEITSAEHQRAGWLTRTKWAAAYYLVAVVDGNITRRLNFGPDGR
jgi:cardiolipin synthase A/B